MLLGRFMRSFVIMLHPQKILLNLQTYKFGADRFRQQDQWASKHAENRGAISLIPCHKI